MRIGILTGGGDVPGLNPCIRSIVLSAIDLGWDVTGFRKGWQGFLNIDPGDPASIAAFTYRLDREAVRGIDRMGGTILHTSRTDPRTVKEGDRTDHVLCVLKALGIDAMITLGGDGTLRFSAHLSAQGFPVISVPKTMDNDVHGTDYCIGFSTAVSRSVEAINALRTTTESHERIAVIELFGRRSGETALLAGFLAQVDRTIIAEVPADLDILLPLLAADRASRPSNYAVCVISEGARLSTDAAADGSDIAQSATKRGKAGVGQRLARQIEERTGIGTVVQELAYLMRAGEPDAMDRMVGFAFGGLAVQLLQRGEYGRMVALIDGNYQHVPIDTLLAGTKSVDVSALYDSGVYRARLLRVEGMPMFLY
ncbi:ATP-dependent 6-phosphofructokinase [Allosphingosinicella flava]|uniref:ATP-dependent 6-phosphofructokinase n=1 Tax=Allosphingosinicella flava TaxID=2771430 RepID=A0A7T2GIK3_9SPHN|nr:ATP-dependent 6-phosphofructokinase [Sphingosinicella flava]QPQ54556.1 ATP-dependent 6-phosphofructokinase [Sphingosinicella flava]